MKDTFKSTAINYGMYLGIILIILTGIGYAVNLDLFLEVWFGIVILLIILVFCIVSIIKSKAALGGYMNFKDAFTAFFITLLVGLAINTLITLIIFNWIDPDAGITLNEKMIDFQVEKMESFNIPSDKIEETIAKIEQKGNLYSPINLLLSLIWQIAGYSILGLIAAAILKKSHPQGK